MTLTGIAADSTVAGGTGARTGRRLLAVAAMLAGGLAGALLALHVGLAAPLIAVAAILAAVATTTRRLAGTRAASAGNVP